MRRLLLLVAIALTTSIAWIPATRAGTVVANVEDGILTVTGTEGNDGITVRCEGGDVTVNQAEPGGGPVACSDLRRVLVFAGGGTDHVRLGDVTRSAFDGLANVSVDGQEGDDSLVGSGVGDSLQGGGGVDSLRGGDGRDLLEPGPGSGEILGGRGKDTVSVFGDGNWFLSDSLLRYRRRGEDNTLRSIERAKIRCGHANSVISAGTFTGALTVDAGRGDDLVASGRGNDRLDGGKGRDFVQSGDGNDILEGRAGDDVLRGGGGNDQLDGGPGDDTCRGGPGADSIVSC